MNFIPRKLLTPIILITLVTSLTLLEAQYQVDVIGVDIEVQENIRILTPTRFEFVIYPGDTVPIAIVIVNNAETDATVELLGSVVPAGMGIDVESAIVVVAGGGIPQEISLNVVADTDSAPGEYHVDIDVIRD